MKRDLQDTCNAQETAKRRDDALKRALNTPPKPHKEKEPAKKDGLHKSKRKPND